MISGCAKVSEQAVLILQQAFPTKQPGLAGACNLQPRKQRTTVSTAPLYLQC